MFDLHPRRRNRATSLLLALLVCLVALVAINLVIQAATAAVRPAVAEGPVTVTSHAYDFTQSPKCLAANGDGCHAMSDLKYVAYTSRYNSYMTVSNAGIFEHTSADLLSGQLTGDIKPPTTAQTTAAICWLGYPDGMIWEKVVWRTTGFDGKQDLFIAYVQDDFYHLSAGHRLDNVPGKQVAYSVTGC